MSNTTSDWKESKVYSAPPAPQAAANNDEIDLGEIFSLLWRRKLLILTALLIAMALGLAYVRQLPNLYEAEAKLILEAQEQNATGLDSLVPGITDEDAEMNSQIEVIKSRQLIGKVVQDLNLVNDPEFVSSLREPSYIAKAIKWLKTQIGTKSEAKEIDPLNSAVDQLTKNLQAIVLPKTHVFKIRIETQDPEKSVLIVNALARAFVDDQVISKTKSTDKAAGWLEDKVNELEVSLNAAEAKAADFRSQTERSVTEEELRQSNQNLKTARGRYDSFILLLEKSTGSKVPTSDLDISRMNSILKNISELEGIVEKQTDDLLTIRQLDREAAAEGEIYKHFATRLNEIQVQKGLHESDVRVLSPAVLRPHATKPRKALNVALFGILGVILSTAYILIRKLMDRSFNDPVELQDAFGIPVIGAIPSAPFPNHPRNRRKLLNYVIKRPSSGIMEAIRDLRTSLISRTGSAAKNTQRRGKTIMFTSSIPAEGKTTSSILLALNASALDQKVLLVECDLRRSTFKTYFGAQTTLGLLNVIQRDDGWEEGIWNEPKTTADIIFGGVAKKQNAGDIFASQSFADFIEEMRGRYDLIVLDTPPVLPVPDARLIANHSDQIVYAVKSASTPSSTVSAGLRLFRNMNLKVDGLVLTQLKKNRGGYGYGYGYGYGSEYYNN